jgi:hypothetical protein
MIPLVGHVVRIAGGRCALDDMGDAEGAEYGQAASSTWPTDTTRLA